LAGPREQVGKVPGELAPALPDGRRGDPHDYIGPGRQRGELRCHQVTQLAPQSVAGHGRADRSTNDESGSCRVCPGSGEDMYDKSAPAGPAPVTHSGREVLAPAYPPLRRQH